ncbi:hypothetical protein RhiirC2_793197, partial [Rhizophagus irregularis]
MFSRGPLREANYRIDKDLPTLTADPLTKNFRKENFIYLLYLRTNNSYILPNSYLLTCLKTLLDRRGGGSYNPNSNRAARQEKKNNKKQLSDNSGSDSDSTTQKRSRIITENTIDEDFIADAPADGGLV